MIPRPRGSILDLSRAFWTYRRGPPEPRRHMGATWPPEPRTAQISLQEWNGTEPNGTERNGREGKRREGNGMNERMSGIMSGLIDEHMEERIDERAHALTNKWKPTLDKNYKTQAMDNNGKKTQHGVFNWSKHQKKHTQPPMVRKRIQQIEISAISTTNKKSTKHAKHI